MEAQAYTSKTLDHLGLVAGMCREIGISEVIDTHCPSDSPDQIVSTGKALEAMILNGLGFVNKRLYLVPHFFRDKPVELLLGAGFESDHFNDDRLGRALDTLYKTGLTTLFTKLSSRTLEVLDYRPDRGHLDSTTMSVFGLYNSEAETSSGLHITQGYSKDKRPDLAQVTLQLISEHLFSIPLHFQMLNGNSSDSESFREVIRTFGKELHTERGLLTIVADSKLYSEQTIQELASAQLNWISRVPGTLQASSELIAKIKASDLKPIESQGYSSACYTYEYGGVHQHWQQQWKWHTLTNIKIHEHKKYGQAGKPTPGTPATLSYTMEAQLRVEQDNYDTEVFKRSMFILATNQQVNGAAEEEQLLRVYKEQHSVERGFRFIKDPNVVASSFFVQKPERVAALAFVMTCCLLVYTALEYRIRKALEKENKTIPDQKNKPTQKPTTRWVFQLFVGIHLLILPDGKKFTLNLDTQHRDILSLLSYWDFYS
jgi:transposase